MRADAGEVRPLVGRQSTTAESYFRMLHKVALGAALALTYISTSTGMIMFNKYVMIDDRFPFSVYLVSIHMATSSILASLLYWFVPTMFPTARLVFGKPGEKTRSQVATSLAPFVPIALLSLISLCCANEAMRYASIAFVQMMKEGSIVFVYVFAVAMGLDTFTFRNATLLTFVAVCAAMATYGEVHFQVLGFLMQLASCIAESLKVVTQSKMMSRGGKLDPLTMVLCTCPLTFIALVPCLFVFWHPAILSHLQAVWPLLLANSALAFMLNVVIAATIKGLSGIGLTLASIVKDLAIVAGSSVVFHNSLSSLQLTGFAGTLTGLSIYSALKLFASKPSRPVPKERSSAAENHGAMASSNLTPPCKV